MNTPAYSSGQRGVTVNHLPTVSGVRISLLALIIVLSGCSAPPQKFTAVEKEYLHDINLYNTPELDIQPKQDLISLGRSMCKTFDTGRNLTYVVDMATSTGVLSENSVITIAASAVTNFCPEHKNVGDLEI